MLLAIDIGNTNVTLGTFENEILSLTARLSTSTDKTANEYAVTIKNVLKLHGKDTADIEDCIISSVVPSVAQSIGKAVTILCGVVPLHVGPGIKTGLNIKIDNPSQLGADLVAGAVGAITEYNTPCIIIDMGTASTIFVVDGEGAFIGGVIAAGVKLTLKALTENTAQLPAIDIKAPKSVIGTNTADCMRSGLIFGASSMIDGIIDKIAYELGEMPTVVATGGLSKEVIKYCNHDIIYNENLLLDGLKEIYDRNK
ncbi:MAG: type III pantothenate kinase [Clostridia bacterium]|nr:type III pantothenate kinase [Clostridia bacterium]